MLYISNAQQETYLVTIIDLLGRELKPPVKFSDPVNKIELDISDLEKGNYVVCISSGTYIGYGKLLVQ